MSDPTIEQLAAGLLAEIAPDQADILPVVAASFYGDEAARRRIVRTVCRPGRGPVAAGVDPGVADLVVQTVLVLLNAIATDAISEAARKHAGLLWRRHRRKLLSIPARRGAATPVPKLAPTKAAAVGDELYAIAVGAKLPVEQAQLLKNLLTARLTEVPAVPGADQP